MPHVNVDALPILEPRPGWRGRFFHSANMTFAYYSIAEDAAVHRHRHDEEEVWHILAGELEVTLVEDTTVAGPGHAVVVPAGEPHSVRALSPCRVIVVDHPARATVGGVDTGAGGAEGHGAG